MKKKGKETDRQSDIAKKRGAKVDGNPAIA